MFYKVAVFLLLILLASCSITNEVVYEDGEGPLPENFLRELKSDSSKTDWIMARLGKPHSSQMLADGVDLYTWHFSRLNQHDISLLFIMNYTVQENQNEYLHVVSQDGLVKKHWIDERAIVSEDVLANLRDKFLLADL